MAVLRSKFLPYNKFEVKGFANCPTAADTPAAIKTYPISITLKNLPELFHFAFQIKTKITTLIEKFIQIERYPLH